MSADYARHTSKLCDLKCLEVSGVKNQFFLLHFDGSTFCLRKEELGLCFRVDESFASTKPRPRCHFRLLAECLFVQLRKRSPASLNSPIRCVTEKNPTKHRSGKKSQIPFVPSRLKALECESIKIISYRGRITNGIFMRHVSRSPL